VCSFVRAISIGFTAMIRVFLLILVLGGLLFVAAGEVRLRWEAPLAIPAEGLHLSVVQGDSLRAVVQKLHDTGVVEHPQLLIYYGRWTGLDQQIKRGEYLLPPQSTAESLLRLLQAGDVIRHQLTLPEGITLAAALEIMWRQADLSRVLEGSNDARIVELTKLYAVPEGLFFPDSYQYELGDTDWDIVQRAHKAMTSVLAQEWSQRSASLPYKNDYEALIMASIIERETGLASERAAIGGVFVRRLQKRMLMQTDPTIIYGLGDAFDGNLKRRHLTDSSNLYNTYRHRGLPPSPIALPGRAAIHAALHPQDGTALYFVARGDGGHEFSATLAEHNRAVRKYQLQRREDYSSMKRKQN
jgi:UPF0755 protein